jgi:TetR/AcrR family transcriptional regulator
MVSNMGIQERKEREKGHRKEEIVDAAQRLFLEKGLMATTMDEIAEAAELSKGTIYLYYKSKEDLFLAVIMRGMQTLYEMFDARIKTETDVVKALAALQETYLAFFHKHRSYFRMLHFLQAPQFHKQVSDEMKRETVFVNQKIWNVAIAIIERGIKEGILIPNLNAVEIAIIFWSSATQLMMRMDTESERWKEMMNVDLERVLRISNSLILGSILTPEAKQNNEALLQQYSPGIGSGN